MAEHQGPPDGVERRTRPSDELARPDALDGAHLSGRYKIQRRLLTTALGRVYVARDLERGAGVRIEVFHPFLTESRTFVEGFAQALSGIGALAYPATLAPTDYGLERIEGDWTAYEVTKPFKGRPLIDDLRALGLPSVAESVRLVLGLLESLEEAHEQGIGHGEISPQVILVQRTDDGELNAKLTGFGVAHLAAHAVPRISYGPITGAPCYRAPEYRRGEPPGPAADLYAVGGVLYYLLTGAPPFSSISPSDLGRLHAERKPESPTTRAPLRGIGAAVERAVLRALAKDAPARFESAGAMAKALTDALAIDEDKRKADEVEDDEDDGTWFPAAPTCAARQDVVARLRALTDAPAESASAGRAVLVLGPAGMGKTTVTAAVAHELAAGPTRIVRVDGRSGSAAPHGPFVEMFRLALGVPRGAGRSLMDAAAESLDAIGLDPLDIERLLDVTSARPPARALGPTLIGREESSALRSAMRRLLEAAPSLLVIEDADALDPASRRLAGELMASAARHRFSVLLTARYDPWPEWQPKHATRVQLEPMNTHSQAELIRERLTDAEVPQEIVDALAKPARGSPWLLSLRARAAVATGALAIDEAEGSWVGDVSQLPSSPTPLVKAILDAAPRGARKWLMGAALAGRRAPIALLDAWDPASGSRQELVDRCGDTELAHRDGAALVFETEGTRLAVRDLVAAKEAKAIHVKFAHWLSSGDPPRAEPQAVAEHLLAAGDIAGAASRFERAGRLMLERRDGPVAVQLLASARSAWAVVPDSVSVARVLLLLAEGLLETGDLRAASDAVEQASLELRQIDTAGGPDRKDWHRDRALMEAVRLRVKAKVERESERLEEAARLLEEAIGLAAPTGNSREWYDIEHDVVSVLLEMGRADEAREHAMVAVEVARTLDKASLGLSDDAAPPSMRVAPIAARSAGVADALSQLGRVELERGHSAAAIKAFESAAEEAAATGDEPSGARAMTNLAHALAEAGDVEGALERSTVAMALASRVGDRNAAARIAFSQGTYRLRLGDASGAAEAYQKARALATAIGWNDGARLAKEAAARTVR